MNLAMFVRKELLDLPVSLEDNANDGFTRLHANENLFPFSDNRSLASYPQASAALAETALADLYGVDVRSLLATRGSDEGIDLLVRALCIPDRDSILVCPPTFGMYEHAARLQGARVRRVPLAEPSFSVNEAVLGHMSDPGVKVVFLCSPNNPTGGIVTHECIERAARACANHAVVVVDEAYIEFSSQLSVSSWIGGVPNLVVLRTLSKAQGLAGARVGAVLAHPNLIGVLRRMRPPYALTSLSIQHAALAGSQERRTQVAKAVAQIIAERQRLFERMCSMSGVREIWPSEANFHLVRLSEPESVFQKLEQAKIRVRRFHLPPLNDCVRVTVGTPSQNDALLSCLENS